MIEGIEVQVISKILTCDDDKETIDTLLSFSPDLYFSAYLDEITYIHDHKEKYGVIPSTFDFMLKFESFTIIQVSEPLEYLVRRLREYRQRIILVETFNKIKDLGDGDAKAAWKYIDMQCEKAQMLEENKPMNIVADAPERAKQVQEFSKQKRIPTGFSEIDKLMYGGLSVVEELLVIIARSNAGKSWLCTRMMESAQENGFPVAYYSPEMQAAWLGTRFDTWRGHFENNKLFKGEYSDEYKDYIDVLKEEETPAFVIEDKDFPDGVSVRTLEPFVKKNKIKLLIIDGISYMQDDHRATRDQEKYKNIATGLFSLSKKCGCACVLVMQANREVKNKDDKGESIPTMYNAEGSDHPCRVATQVFGVRQIFDKHVLDIALLKSRMANNQNPVLSYAWDINTGNTQYIPGDNNDSSAATSSASVTPTLTAPTISFTSTNAPSPSETLSLIDDDDDSDIEF